MEAAEIIALCAIPISLVALFVSILANRNAGRAADAAERQALAAEAALPPPPAAVAWKLERQFPDVYLLRNIGTDEATGVRITFPEAYDDLVRFDLGDGRVRAGASITVMMIRTAERSDLAEISVAWDGNRWPVQVALPPA